jgi:hypothetical protein
MTLSVKGIVHGNTIELAGPLGVPDGEEVLITVETSSGLLPATPLAPGEGIRRAAGAWDDDPAGLDAFLKWNRLQRKSDRRSFEV